MVILIKSSVLVLATFVSYLVYNVLTIVNDSAGYDTKGSPRGLCVGLASVRDNSLRKPVLSESFRDFHGAVCSIRVSQVIKSRKRNGKQTAGLSATTPVTLPPELVATRCLNMVT